MTIKDLILSLASAAANSPLGMDTIVAIEVTGDGTHPDYIEEVTGLEQQTLAVLPTGHIVPMQNWYDGKEGVDRQVVYTITH